MESIRLGFEYLFQFLFPPESLKAALVLVLASTWILIGLFAYLNRFTRRHYFTLWTIAWMFYALWITSKLTFFHAASPNAEWVKAASIGICAIYLFWGTLLFSGRAPSSHYFGLLVGLMIVWNYVSGKVFGNTFWMTLPLFLMLSAASFFTSIYFLQRLVNDRYVGASILGVGFGLWGLAMIFYPFMDKSEYLQQPGFIAASGIQLVIAIGMIVLMLEEVRGETRLLQDQVKADARLTHELQKEIQLSKSKYEHLFDQANDGIAIIDPLSLQILEVNRALQTLTGYTREELLQLRFVNICPIVRDKESQIAEDPSQLKKVFTTHGNVPIQRKDNNIIMAEGTSSEMSYAKGRTLQVFLREVTERRRLEQQLRQAEKLSALGQLISGVAHELNNPLAVISGYSQLLVMRPNLDPKTHSDLVKVQHESERASKIIQNFLTFARKQPLEKSNVNINTLLESSLDLMDYDLRASGVGLAREFHSQMPDVFADPNQLEQVFLNIIKNAIQSMEGSPLEKMLMVRTLSTEAHVKMVFIDRGTGIAESLLGKIFDPFFTTKEVGRGTGLGLSISYSIIKEHSGTIYAQNNAEGGSTFTIELPISHVKSGPPQPKKNESSPRIPKVDRARTFQVLVVDDEIAIQDVFSELLVDFSCRVQGASNGLLAMQLIQKNDFDLVISDLKMPVMDGRWLYEKVKEIKPALCQKFIFITGDSNSQKTVEFLEKSGNRWMLKPFNFREVETLITEHLNGIQEKERSQQGGIASKGA
jgi:PAS domain S-box-containing protein